MAAPVAPHSRPKLPTATSAWRRMARAFVMSPAPMAWATCTENPVAAAEHDPLNSHVVVDTSPMAAAASAPRLPTMAASMYCIRMDDNWAMMAGTLSIRVSCSCWRVVIGSPWRMRASRESVVIALMGFFFFSGEMRLSLSVFLLFVLWMLYVSVAGVVQRWLCTKRVKRFRPSASTLRGQAMFQRM